ncbi:MAG: hypothetical protein ACOCZE_12720 [Planctomycetota bacterium]
MHHSPTQREDHQPHNRPAERQERLWQAIESTGLDVPTGPGGVPGQLACGSAT